MQPRAALNLHYDSTAFSLQPTIVHGIRVGISEVKLCVSLVFSSSVQKLYFEDLSCRGTAPANSPRITKNQKRAVRWLDDSMKVAGYHWLQVARDLMSLKLRRTVMLNNNSNNGYLDIYRTQHRLDPN
ncbi:hypothetical protein EVAR_38060_1 [Eumeta japonica]|uniref:Uncharacterized protein n=1 Tax=Eumeta variegata TaxID=151549 RepID=A0A4C1W7F6_EUMVA|nr:hypothetical protein EVAR_38060_1 [Eumeta japonica]